jgi:membrane fusion protein (multidrug efflux system)
MRLPSTLVRYVLVISTVSIVVMACRKKQSGDDEEGRTPPKATVAVKMTKVVEGDAVIRVTAFGKTDALKKEKIYAPIAGRITSLKVFEGSAVRQGDVIALIQTKESQSAILGAETMLKSATTPEQKAEAERILRLARSTQNSVTMTAKFDGFVSTRSVSEGELVSENAELMTIIDLSTIDFLADVPLRDLPSVKTDQHASILFQTMPGHTYQAVVDAINPQTDIQSQTVKVRLRFVSLSESLHSLLRTDMIGTASIVIGTHPRALFVPKAGLLRNDEENSYSIVTITPDSLSVRIPVVVGIVTDSTAEIQGPSLRPGMPVITEGNYSLTDSTRVTISQQGKE